ncbi:glycosyltransferase [Brevundimonas naejangsanensis]|uniref:Glycosyltransferase n=1 Tax=Brevundimonas naejangsanensis TaxID=588932 RepID=A0A494RDA9_9CAUL|nr:glycosyltransferase [Brevundimonas naejangsanensis]AYG94285.1 glycosyltransferase [Brevundimonas naejangsanensis]
MSNEMPLVSVVTVVRNRAAPLAQTIESVRAQTYGAIEHIVVDGGSTDETLDVIRRYADGLASWTSEPDEGIYDAINKGIRRATGDYVLILHAADTYEPDFVERLVQAAPRADEVVYSSYTHGARSVKSSVMTDGVFLHHLGINHSAFLVPKAVYERVGLYDPGLRIVSDAIWMRRAREMGVAFRLIEGRGLYFAEGGLSSAQSEAHRRLVIREWVNSYRLFFPFLPEDVAEALYLYRFEEKQAGAILRYVRTVLADLQSPDFHASAPLFLSALKEMLHHVWGLRRVKAEDPAFQPRWDLCRVLGLDPRRANIEAAGVDVAALIALVEGVKRAAAGRKVLLHYLEVFSRPSETFIPDLINRWNAHDDRVHVVLCDKRVLPNERPFDLVVTLNPAQTPPRLYRALVEDLIGGVEFEGFVFHFAINGWRLLSRLGEAHQKAPALYMCHGIDVFDLVKDTDYSRYLLGVAARSPASRFTAVSRYLRDALVDAGVPFHKVSLVHNVVHDRFFQHRKPGREKTAARRGGAPVRIVSIGRLVGWKGQEHLLCALALLKRRGREAHVTFVYGQEDRELEHLRAVAAREGVSGGVTFRPFVNFDEEPDFLNAFDLLVSASTYTSGQGARSETFGMSILEGIAAGLPVVVTDAGGQPEVAGEPNDHVRIARHADPESLAQAIEAIIDGGGLNGDNLEVARARLEHFSGARQMALLEEALATARSSAVRPLLLSTALTQGAGGAARGVHLALLAAGVPSTVRFRNLFEGWKAVPGAAPLRIAASRLGDNVHPRDAFLRQDHTIFSIDTDGVPQAELEAMVADVDVINLHWYARFLSNENIAWLTNCGKPVVFTIRDMHPLTGGCHFFHGCDNWRQACLPCPQFQPAEVSLPHAQFAYKRDNWNMDNVSVVVLSDHTRAIVEQSPLFAGCRVEKIPNPIDTTVFRPIDQAEARRMLDLPADKRIVAYVPSFNSAIKGAAEFERMLKRLARETAAEDLVVICAGRRQIAIDAPFEIRQLGHIADKTRLAAFFSAADVTVIPSLEETFSNTALESIACGTPIAGFRTGAIGEFAQGGRGRSAPVGDVTALALAVRDVLADAETCPRAENHAYAARHHAPERIGAAYARFFEEARQRVATVKPIRDAALPNALAHYLAARLEAAHAQLAAKPPVVQSAAPAAKVAAPNPLPGPWIAANDSARVATTGAAVLDLIPLSKRAGSVIDSEGGLRLEVQDEAGHRLYGPNIRLVQGRYRLDLELSVPWRSRFDRALRASRMVAEIVWNVDDVIEAEIFELKRAGPGRFRWRPEFEIGPELAAKVREGLEVRLWTDGRQPWLVSKKLLRQLK